jgi:hypothetical protein
LHDGPVTTPEPNKSQQRYHSDTNSKG